LLGNGVWFDDVVANRYERTISEERDDHEHQHRKLEEGGPWVAFLDWLADVFSVFVLPKFVSFRVVGLSLEQMRERQEGREGGGARVVVRCLALGGTFDMVFKLERERASDGERARDMYLRLANRDNDIAALAFCNQLRIVVFKVLVPQVHVCGVIA
jgi:hypothetical protein